jgi:membrane protein YqaA with SNARE-associated domain
LTAVAGVLRTPLIVFIPIVALAKFIRYVVVVWVAGAFL